MKGKVVISGGKALLDIILDRRTGHKIEDRLNTCLHGETREFTNYDNNVVEIQIESITVRPKYFPEGPRGGIQQVEADDMFTKLDADRESSSFLERFNAILKNHWVTVVTLKISTGNLDDIRPPGINLGYISIIGTMIDEENSDISQISFLRTPHVNGIETGDLQSDKLKFKLPYSGSVGEYRTHISRGLDFIEQIQNRFEKYGFSQLMDLHRTASDEGREPAWQDREQAKQLGQFVLSKPVDVDLLAESIEEFKENEYDENRIVNSEE